MRLILTNAIRRHVQGAHARELLLEMHHATVRGPGRAEASELIVALDALHQILEHHSLCFRSNEPLTFDLAVRFFRPEEHPHLRRMLGAERDRAFYRMWVHKEACLKATGAGLTDLRECAAILDDSDVSDRRRGDVQTPAQSINACRLLDLPVHRDYCAALAIAPDEVATAAQREQ
jgi:phosphopantetheinyl transferase (holo-ACP synthase)